MAFDRQRGGWYSAWTYPTTTLVGASIPFQSTMCVLGDNILLGGGDGQLYMQPTRLIAGENAMGVFDSTFPLFTTDDTSINVVSTIRSSLLWFGDGGLQKQIRRWIFAGASLAASASVIHRIYDHSGTLSTASTLSSKTLPFQTESPTLDTTTKQIGVAFQIELQASNLILQGVDCIYRLVRAAASYALT